MAQRICALFRKISLRRRKFACLFHEDNYVNSIYLSGLSNSSSKKGASTLSYIGIEHS